MELKNIIFVLIFISAFGFLAFSLNKVIGYLKLGQKENRFDNIPKRIMNVLKIAFGQSKLLRDPVAGTVHFLIFWGFMLFIFAVMEAIIQGFYSPFTFEFLGPIFSVITIVQDLFGILVIFAVLFALYRRFIQKVERLDVSKAGNFDAAFILLLIFFVVLSMFAQNISLVAKNNFELAAFEIRPLSYPLATIFYSNSSAAEIPFEIFWWIHILLVFGFMNYLPYSKHFHVITSIPNVFFSKFDDKKYALKPINLEDENIEQYGVADVEHLTWKQMLDGYACTECGRCTAACPAASTGKSLSPRKIIVDIRRRVEEKIPLMANGIVENEGITNKSLINDYITPEELWACTSCNACVFECPVSIEHLDSMIEMRRNLVLMESSFPQELNSVFKNLETNFSPWAFNHQDRAAWAEGMDIKTMAEDPITEVLFWVGCAGSYDSRYQKVTKAFSNILKEAGVNFRILGTEEKCNGDTARRLGNEYLAQMMMQENIETLNGYNVKKIVTGCPHCYNSLKNEYPQFGGNFEVRHHTEMIEELLEQNKIKLKDESVYSKTTFHDSCYLGRYNNLYDSPRNPLKNIKGLELVEMDRNKDKGFCCGAGGGRMFLEETQGTRINVNRTEEALNTGADTIASACPFCMTMMNDGVKSFEKQEKVSVKDVAEIVWENLIK